MTHAARVTFPETFSLADYFLFDRLQEGLGEKTALRFGPRAYSYGDVAARSLAVARFLGARGVEREQRVYVVLPDTPPFAWAFFGALANGSVVAMGNPVAPRDDLAYVIDYVRASALITVPAVVRDLAPALASATQLKTVLVVPDVATGEDPEGECELPALTACEVLALRDAVAAGRVMHTPRREIRRDDPAIWLFTSGSTGRPKAAVHAQRDFAYNTEVYAKRTVGYRREDVTVSVPGLFFGYATGTNLMFPFAVGATSCLFAERPTPEVLAGAVDMYRPTVVTNVPTMMSKLLEYDAARREAGETPLDFSSIRFHLSAGEALPPPLLERFMGRFGNDVYDGIGSAEMFHIYASNRPGDIRPGSLGRAVEGYELRVLATDAGAPGAPELPRGETGVLWVRGESVAFEYHGDRDKSWSTFYGPWCRTGDLFRMDADGYLWFSGRADSLFKVGGVFVAPLEIEECLMTHGAVSLAAVIPAEDAGLTKPKAFVVLREGTVAAGNTLQRELQEHVKERLSKHKYPRWVVFVDDLPRNDRGKIDRRVLVERERRGENS
ncbi:MAG: benzoate-CoA ligase family protein [Candidatus Krumholzibacteria bacterium]|nr:benzoate-CoA ligase family protein [Candidatus Krumholzibacteria bacterium]MDH4336413.1 benzoate-CoA ligase family protein [Candidatus Krumholzibacteria bacterium]MDH5269538.1 benzoate-CoA ligase family protein [Candidatus Krumholzibacteria bacterium]